MSYTKLGMAALAGVAAAYGLDKRGRRAEWEGLSRYFLILPPGADKDATKRERLSSRVAGPFPTRPHEKRRREKEKRREKKAMGFPARGRKASRKHKLMTAELRRKLPALYANENVKDPIVQAKYFSPYGNAYWLITEYDGDDTMFGWAELGAGMGELGYVSLSELDEVVGGSGLLRGIPMVERDLYFDPQPLSEAKRREQERRGFAARGRRGRRASERTLEEHINALQRMFPGTLVRPGVEFDERPIPRIWTSFGEEMKDDVYIADYYRDKYHPKLQQYMDKYDIMPEWYDAGTLFLVPNRLWEKWSSEQTRLRRGRQR